MQGIRIRKRIDENLFQRMLRNSRLNEKRVAKVRGGATIKKIEEVSKVEDNSKKCKRCKKKFQSNKPSKLYCTRQCNKLFHISAWQKRNPEKVLSYRKRKVNCLNCNKEFIGKKYCSFECATIYIEKNFDIKEEEVIQKCEHCPHCKNESKSSLGQKECLSCGKLFDVTKPGYVKKYCSDNCRIKGYKFKSAKDLRNNDGKPVRGQILKVNCKGCNKEFEYIFQRGLGKKYCTVDCRTKYYESLKKPIEKVHGVSSKASLESKKEIPVLDDEEDKEDLKLFNPHDDNVDREVKLTWPELIKDYDGMTPKDLAYFRHAVLAKHNQYLDWKDLTKGSKMRYDLYCELWKSGARGIMRHWRTS